MNRKYAHRTGPVLLALATLLIIGCDTTSKPNATAKAKSDVEGAVELARAVKGMHDAFLEAGFDGQQALALSVEWMRTVLRP